jgi:uncharacterized YccA/Bax inhibitor family protein
MQSNNPIFSRAEGFNGQSAGNYGHQAYPAGGQGYQGYGQPTPPPLDPSGFQYPRTAEPAIQERMTIDSVVSRTAITLFVIVAVAAATWTVLPDEYLGPAWMIGAFGGLGMSFVVAFKRTVSPALVLGYAALEGLFLGAVSEFYNDVAEGAVAGAVLGTVAAFAATLAAYKFFNIQVTERMRKYITVAMLGFFALLMMDLILSLFGDPIGFAGFGTLGLIMSFVGLGIGIFMLLLDFDMVERGVAAGLPESESWRAAFGLAVTLIWIYINLLRIFAILQSDG